MCDEERGFWAAIEADPADMTARLVFADWLAEHDDPREQGMRALAACGWRPYGGTVGNYSCDRQDFSALPDDWFSIIAARFSRDHYHNTGDGQCWIGHFHGEPGLILLFEAALLTFVQLPEQRRIELLTWAGVRRPTPKARRV